MVSYFNGIFSPGQNHSTKRGCPSSVQSHSAQRIISTGFRVWYAGNFSIGISRFPHAPYCSQGIFFQAFRNGWAPAYGCDHAHHQSRSNTAWNFPRSLPCCEHRRKLWWASSHSIQNDTTHMVAAPHICLKLLLLATKKQCWSLVGRINEREEGTQRLK